MIRHVALLAVTLLEAAFTDLDCTLPGKDAVLHARSRGFAFTIAKGDTTGTCQSASNDVVYIASATSTAGTTCRIRLFSGKLPLDSTSIVLVQLTNDDNGAIVIAKRDSSQNAIGWIAEIAAPAGTTQRYRVSSIQIATNKECSEWKTRFQ